VALVLLAGCGGGDRGSVQDEKHPPVVVVVFDEFPVDDLLRPDGQIDADRYPNFARLASIATWFPNAFTTYDSTFKAVPSILDARLPQPGTAPDVRSHKPSVYNLMHRLGYQIFKVESASAVCQPAICAGTRTRRPSVLDRLAGGGRPERFHAWVGAIRRRDRPGFYLNHTLLPHEPWIYLPDGRRSRPTGEDPIPGINQPPSFDDRGVSIHNHLRHLLQVGFVDRQIGVLLRRLERTEMLDDALLVVVADHGYSFDIGVPSRRLVNDRSIDEIAPVPFFLKEPGQMEGKVDDSFVRNIDVVPTIADLLGSKVWWRNDGHSAFSDETRDRDEVALVTRDFERVIRISPDELARRRLANRQRWARLFGTGLVSRLVFGDPWEEAYRIGPHRELLGRRVASLPRAPGEGITAQVLNDRLMASVSTHAELLPTRVSGRIYGVPSGTERDLAVAVNGRIRALGRSFHLWRNEREYFSMMVPESALRDGANRIEVYAVHDGDALSPLGGG